MSSNQKQSKSSTDEDEKKDKKDGDKNKEEEKKPAIGEIPKSYRQWVLATRPADGQVPTIDNFKLKTVETPTKFEKNQVFIRILYLSVDPYIRGTISSTRQYSFSTNVGDVVVGWLPVWLLRRRILPLRSVRKCPVIWVGKNMQLVKEII